MPWKQRMMEVRQRAEARLAELAKTDSELSALMPDAEVTRAIQQPALSYQQILTTVFASYAERPALGTRAYEIATDPDSGDRFRRVLPSYATLSYGELGRQVEAVASFWRHEMRYRVKPGEMVAFLAFNGAEMTAADLACGYAGAVVVPLQANYPTRDLDEILSDTAPVALVASIDNLALAVTTALRHDSIRSVLVIAADRRIDADRRAIDGARAQLGAAGGRVALATFAEAMEAGGRFAFEPPPLSGGRDRMVMLMYTSGSTGTPKGAIIHEAICVAAWTTPRSAGPMVAFIFAPMNHSLGRYALYSALGQGGTAYFTQRSDLSTMLEDLQLARPTSMVMIPRMCELAQQHHLSEVSKRIASGMDVETADRAVRAEMRHSFLGDRLVSASVGSAPTTPELRQFMSDVFEIALIDGYGNTESGGGGITVDGHISPAVLDFKLIDVPELGYYVTDRPFPRGELLVKTRTMISGYYKRPEATAAIFDPDGFLKTGDVMEQRGPRELAWLDRRNNVIKLAQGEYVAMGPLESAYLGHSRLIDQIYLYGSSQRAFLLAVVVPAMDVARELLGHEPSDDELRRLVVEDMRAVAGKAERKAFEVPRDVLIEREPFSLHNGLLSAVGKPLRANLRNRYDEALEAIYADMERRLGDERAQLRGDGRPTRERVAEAIKLDLGLAELDPGSPDTYTRLGGDSLGAVNLSLLLEEVFGIEVPVTNILHPAANPAWLAARIDDLLAGSRSATLYDTIHPDRDQIRATDLTLDRLLGGEVLAGAALAAQAPDETRTVLITGANGFLGRFLCLEWLDRMAARDGKVICLVRGSDLKAARARMFEAIGDDDPALRARFAKLAERYLEVLPADLSAPRMGLDEATFGRLAVQVDHVVHVAALVNHRLAYRNLFEPNVLGTAELVRLALAHRRKRFDYISTIAVAHLNAEIARAPESADVRIAVPAIDTGADRPALGYGASKWAGEVILREAHDAFGLSVNVFRADMILPHARYAGQINAPDSFTRLLASLIMTGIAPTSFYRLGASGERQPAHYDGLPVDFVATAIQQISARALPGFHTYTLANPHHADAISLDTIADWLGSAGHGTLRLDHAEWYGRFKEQLENLPADMRRNSCLPIVARFANPYPAELPPIACSDFVNAVREIEAGPDIPHLSEAYVHKCVRDMELLDLIGQPEPVPV
jgi:fatty acid CoA ligase FadD9